MTEQEFQTMKEQVKADIIRDMEKVKRNKIMIRGVMDEYNSEFEKFDWVDHSASRGYQNQHEAYKLRTAIGAILRITLQKRRLEQIPEELELVVRGTIDQILKIMQEVQHEV